MSRRLIRSDRLARPVPVPLAVVGLILSALLLSAALSYAIAAALTFDAPAARAPYELALRFFPDHRLRAELALRELDAQRHSATPDWGRAAQALDAALQSSAQDPFSWARLAYVRVQQGDEAGAQTALLHSFQSGRVIPGFMNWRFVLGLGLWPRGSDEFRAQLSDQAGILWRQNKWSLIRLARLAPFASQIESIILLDYPEFYEEFLHGRGPLGHTQGADYSIQGR